MDDFLVMLQIGQAILVGYLAKNKGRNLLTWGIYGLLLPIIPILHIYKIGKVVKL